MNVLDKSLEVVEPIFDRPENTDSALALLSVGTRVSLIYRGSPLPLQVEAVEQLGTSFVGRIRDTPDDLPLVRFRVRDIVSID